MPCLAEIMGFLAAKWAAVLVAVAVFAVTTFGSVWLVAFFLVRLPAAYLRDPRSRGFWLGKHPALRWTGLIGKNLLGAVLVALGIILSLPGVPGAGLLTILVGVLLLDFPGKRRLERWLLGRPKVLRWVNRLRQRHGRPPLEAP